MKSRKIIRSLAVLAALVYAAYFVLGWAMFSLLTDHQSLAIERLISSQVSLIDIGVRPSPTPPAGPNRTAGCSFLLMEELWRDCKSVRVGVAETRLSREQVEELRRRVLPIVTRPCKGVQGLSDGVAAEIRKQLGCAGREQRYVVTVLYLHRGALEKLFVAEGGIE